MLAACFYVSMMLPSFLCTDAEPPKYEPPPVIASHWIALAVCESGMNGVPRWDYNGSSGFDGGLQFHPRTWTAFKPDNYPDYAYQATPSQQVHVAQHVQAEQGWGAWPTCSTKVGLR